MPQSVLGGAAVMMFSSIVISGVQLITKEPLTGKNLSIVAVALGVGYGMGDVTLENFLVTHKLLPETFGDGVKVLVTRFADVPYEAYTNLVDTLRAEGITASIYLGQKKFGKQLEFAAKDGYSHVVIMGGSELENGVIRIKDFATREECELPVADAIALLKNARIN
jgi:histidyl-tRNA synthetase